MSFHFPELMTRWICLPSQSTHLLQILRLVTGEYVTRIGEDCICYTFQILRVCCDAIWIMQCPSYIPATYRSVLAGLIQNTCMVYLDDILVLGATLEYFRTLAQVFDCLRKAGPWLKPTKCHLPQKEIMYFGFIVTDKGWQLTHTRLKLLVPIPPLPI